MLGHRRVYIVPSRLGLLFGGTLAILLVGSINYALSLGFALTFLLAGMGIAGMVQTARNLAQLSVRAGRCDPVFAGDSGAVPARAGQPAATSTARRSSCARSASGAQLHRRHRPGLGGGGDAGGAGAAPRLAAARARDAGDALSARPVPRLELRRARQPLPGLPAARGERPAAGRPPSAQAGGARAHAQGSDDFSGLRAYQPSDSPRHVAWKSVARSDTQHARSDDMLTKQFAGDAVAELWLDLRDLPASLGLEQRLSRLAGWVLAAERAGARYGLRLPGSELAPGTGDAQRAACLEALALYE